MSDIALKWVGWRKGYEGRSGWPAKDLTQEELDARGLDKAAMLAYRPKLYEEVKPEIAEVKSESTKKRSRRSRSADPSLRTGSRTHGDTGDGSDSGELGESLHPIGSSAGKD